MKLSLLKLHLFKAGKEDGFKTSILILSFFFAFYLSNHNEILSTQIISSLLLIVPLFFITQEMQHSVKIDLKEGILEQFIGNAHSLSGYIFYKNATFFIFYIFPYITLSCLFLSLSIQGFPLLATLCCFMLMGITFTGLGALLGLCQLPGQIISIFFIPLQIPGILWTLAALQTHDYLSPIFICSGIFLFSQAIIIWGSQIIQRIIF